MALIIVALLTLSAVSAAVPFGFSTILSRPTLYFDDTTADPLYVDAGSYVNITTAGMTITGAQVWLWLSANGGSEVNTAEGDRWIAGPFLLSNVDDTVSVHAYSFSGGVLPAPFNTEGRTYSYVVGGGWINGTVPLLVQGSDVDYWIKVVDVAPRDIVEGSEVGVSTNRLRFNPAFDASPLTGAPGTPVTASGYATSLTVLYNVTQAGLPAQVLVGSTTNNASGWLWTGFSASFSILDLKGKTVAAPAENGSVAINVIQNGTAATVATFAFTQVYREVYLPSFDFKAHGGDYSGGPPIMNTSTTYGLTLGWFPYMGSADVYLNDTLLASGVSLNGTGGASTTITVPPVQTGNYLLRVVDSFGVEYNFTVLVFMWTYIYLTPASGHVGDAFTVTGVNFLPYIGQHVTIYFENSVVPPYYILLLNFTVTQSIWNQQLVVPQSWGGDRKVEVRNSDGTTVIAVEAVNVTAAIVVPVEYHEVTVDQTTYIVATSSNSTVSGFSFSQVEASIRFGVDGLTGTMGFCNVTIPSELMSGTFTIYMDDLPLAKNVDYTETYNGTHYLFTITYEHSAHTVELVSTTVIPELTSLALLLTFITATIAVIIANRKRKRH